MKRRATTILLIFGFVSAACISSPRILRGQAPPGPLPPARPLPQTQAPPQLKEQQPQQPQQKLTLSGAWKLNRDESDDPRKKMQEARGRDEGGPYGGGRRPGGGFPFPGGGGGGPYGGRRGRTESGQGDQDPQRMQELFRPADSLTIALKDAEVDLTDDQGRKRVFYTDGRQLQKSRDDNYQEQAAHWEGSRLVSEEKGFRGRKVTRSLELASGGQQLYETLHLDNGRSGSPVTIRYVYDIAGASESKPRAE